MNRKIDISIVVPCRNEIRHIRGFLNSLIKQELEGLRWEAIIADGMSTDGTRDIIDQYMAHAPVHRIDNPERIVSTGLNRAIRQASGEFILRMDIHTEYAPNYVRLCVETLVKTGAWNAGGPARTKADGWIGHAIAAAYHSPFACGGARFHDEEYEGWVDTVTYGCWRKATLEKIGLFDESLVRNQDDELNLRIVRAGGGIWQSPVIVSWYYPRNNLGDLARQYYQYGFWKVAVIRKHRLPASWRHLIPGVFVMAVTLGLTLAGSLWAAGFHGASLAATSIWLAVIAFYVIACGAAALWTAHRSSWRLLPLLPVIFPCYHLSYGLGFLSALAFLSVRGSKASAGKLFTDLTR